MEIPYILPCKFLVFLWITIIPLCVLLKTACFLETVLVYYLRLYYCAVASFRNRDRELPAARSGYLFCFGRTEANKNLKEEKLWANDSFRSCWLWLWSLA